MRRIIRSVSSDPAKPWEVGENRKRREINAHFCMNAIGFFEKCFRRLLNLKDLRRLASDGAAATPTSTPYNEWAISKFRGGLTHAYARSEWCYWNSLKERCGPNGVQKPQLKGRFKKQPKPKKQMQIPWHLTD